MPEKGLRLLLQALALFRQRNAYGSLVVVGSGPERQILVDHARDLGIAESVNFAGSRDMTALAQHYAEAECLLLPSESEPWGLVVNEALHHGCPAVVSDVCGCRPDLIADGITGFAFPSGDVAALCACMTQVVAAFSDTSDVARRCQAHVARFTPERAAQHILEGCQTVLSAA